MIEMTFLNSAASSQHSAKEMRASHDPTAFAKKLDDASSKANNRRQVTGKMAEEPEKSEGRKAWAHDRSRADHRTDQTKEAKPDVHESNDELDQTDQDEAMESGHSLLMWLLDMPDELRDVANSLMEEDMAISEDSMKKILLWMQSMTKVDNLPEELKALVEKLTSLLQDRNGLVTSLMTSEQKADFEAFLSQIDRLAESTKSFSTDIAAVKSTDQEVLMQPNVAAEVMTENSPADTAKTKETQENLEVAFMKEITTIEDQRVKNVTTNLSDQSKEKGFAFQGKPDEVLTQEQNREVVIPFSLAQIETFLQQNTMTVASNQEQTQIQQNVMQQIVDKMQVIQGTNQSFVSLQLSPEHLGKLTIQLISDMQQGMTAKIYAETPQAKEMIESNFGQLKDALSGKGVNLTAMEVFVGQDPESSEKQREFQYQQARAQRRRGSKIGKVSNSDNTLLVSEMPISNNPYVTAEGFDQLG